MANLKSAKKRVLTNAKKAAVNSRVKDHLKQSVKNVELALAANDVAKAEEAFKAAEKELKQAASKKVISKNAASRKTSRLQVKLNAVKAAK